MCLLTSKPKVELLCTLKKFNNTFYLTKYVQIIIILTCSHYLQINEIINIIFIFILLFYN